jgi:HD superfamily phosphohydrolase
MKIFRDPIHNVINLSTGNDAIDNLIIKLVDSKEFQRLRYIRQLGFAYVAYPNATHTRFEHSLGVAWLAKRFLEKIISIESVTLNYYEDPKDTSKLIGFFEQIRHKKALTIIAALLHDVGHGPLSHIIEEYTGVEHEKWTKEIILGKTEIHELLENFDSEFPQKVVNILCGSEEPSAKIISGQLDIDKMDYLLRDSYMTGAGYGKFDMEWLFNVITVGLDKKGNVEIGLDLGKGLCVAENLITARIDMFKNVYLHKTNLVAQDMLKKLFNRFTKLSKEAVNAHFNNQNTCLKRLLFEKEGDISQKLEDYLSISDLDLFYHLKQWQNSSDDVIRRLSYGIVNRRLLKVVDQNEFLLIRQFIAESRGSGEEEYYTTKITIDARRAHLTYSADKDKGFLFDRKNRECFDILETSNIIPPSVL